MTTECPICCEDAKTNVKCHFCEYYTCRQCCQHYLLHSIDPAHCMNCRKGWTRDVLLQYFPKTWVTTTYKQHRENVLMDNEMALLPATQPYAEVERRKRMSKQGLDDMKKAHADEKDAFFSRHPGITEYLDAMSRIENAILPLIQSQYSYYTRVPCTYLKDNQDGLVCDFPCRGKIENGRCTKCMASICEACGLRYFFRAIIPFHRCRSDNVRKHQARLALIEDYRQLMQANCTREYKIYYPIWLSRENRFQRDLQRRAHELRLRNTRRRAEEDNDDIPVERRLFVRACPANGCRGFLSTAWKCGMCDVFVCPQCHEIKGEARDTPHECNPENIETARLLAKDTKPCPSCGTRIFKIEGCDQMFCTQCHTAFSWRTGAIEKGNIHNPHYYEYLRQQNQGMRNVGDIPCGGIPFYTFLHRHVSKYMKKHEYDDLQPFHRLVGEVMDLRTWYQEHTAQDTQAIRVKYLLRDYDDKAFKKLLHMKAKAHEKMTNIDQVLDMFVMAATSILQRIQTLNTHKELLEIFTELHALKSYTDASMKRVGKRYDCKTPWIDDKLVLHRVGERIRE
jgi:hypothetical protein